MAGRERGGGKTHRGVKLCAEYARLVRPRFKSAAEQPNRTPLHLRFSPPSSARLMGNHVRHAHPPCSIWGRTKSQDARVGQALLGNGEDHAISFSFHLQCSPRGRQASQLGNPAVGTSSVFKSGLGPRRLSVLVPEDSSPARSLCWRRGIDPPGSSTRCTKPRAAERWSQVYDSSGHIEALQRNELAT